MLQALVWHGTAGWCAFTTHLLRPSGPLAEEAYLKAREQLANGGQQQPELVAGHDNGRCVAAGGCAVQPREPVQSRRHIDLSKTHQHP